MVSRCTPIAVPVMVAMLSAVVTAAVPRPLQTRDIDGVVRDVFRPTGPVGVILFVASDCPVSNGYAPEIQRICAGARTKDGSCTLVYEDSSIDEAAVRAHLGEYRYREIPAVIDHDHAIAQRARAIITPQAVVVTPVGVIKYRGRIDDRYIALGRQRRVVTSHDLRDAIDALIGGRAVPHPETEAVGCFIPQIRGASPPRTPLPRRSLGASTPRSAPPTRSLSLARVVNRLEMHS
jgi:hypothetical protein